MDDYFEATKKENATAGAPAGNGDAMEEIEVRTTPPCYRAEEKNGN